MTRNEFVLREAVRLTAPDSKGLSLPFSDALSRALRHAEEAESRNLSTWDPPSKAKDAEPARTAVDAARDRVVEAAREWWRSPSHNFGVQEDRLDALARAISSLHRAESEAKRGASARSVSGETREDAEPAQAEIARLKAALDAERKACDEAQRALNLGIEFAFDASDGRPGIDTAREIISAHDARRAAEAKEAT